MLGIKISWWGEYITRGGGCGMGKKGGHKVQLSRYKMLKSWEVRCSRVTVAHTAVGHRGKLFRD